MAKKRVLITGAAGFLGSHLCDRFITEGFQVIAMDNLITGDLKNIEHLFKHPDFEFYHPTPQLEGSWMQVVLLSFQD